MGSGVAVGPDGRVDAAAVGDGGDDARQFRPVGTHQAGQAVVVQLRHVAADGLREGLEGGGLLGAGPPVEDVAGIGSAHGLHGQPGLARTGVAPDEHDLASSPTCRGPGPLQPGQFGLPSHEGAVGQPRGGDVGRVRSSVDRGDRPGLRVQQPEVGPLGLLRGGDTQFVGQHRAAHAVGPECGGPVPADAVGLHQAPVARLVVAVPLDRGRGQSHRVVMVAAGRRRGRARPQGPEEVLGELGPVVVQPVAVQVGQERRVEQPDRPPRSRLRSRVGPLGQAPFGLGEVGPGPVHVHARIGTGEAVPVADVVQSGRRRAEPGQEGPDLADDPAEGTVPVASRPVRPQHLCQFLRGHRPAGAERGEDQDRAGLDAGQDPRVRDRHRSGPRRAGG